MTFCGHLPCIYSDVYYRWYLTDVYVYVCVLSRSSRKNAKYHLTSWCWEEKHISKGTDFDTTPGCSPSTECLSAPPSFTLVSVTVPLHLLCLLHQDQGLFFFCSVEFPQLFQLFHRYLEIVSRENNVSELFFFFFFLFFWTVAEVLPVWPNATIIFVENIRSRYQLLHCVISMYYRMINYRKSLNSSFCCYCFFWTLSST